MADTRKQTDGEQAERERLVATLLRFNPWGGYCVKPCRHRGHTTQAYRDTVARIEGRRSA